MAEPRVKAALWVQMALRLSNSAGRPAVVVRKGDPDSGGVLAVLRGRAGLSVLTQVRTAEGGGGLVARHRTRRGRRNGSRCLYRSAAPGRSRSLGDRVRSTRPAAAIRGQAALDVAASLQAMVLWNTVACRAHRPRRRHDCRSNCLCSGPALLPNSGNTMLLFRHNRWKIDTGGLVRSRCDVKMLTNREAGGSIHVTKPPAAQPAHIETRREKHEAPHCADGSDDNGVARGSDGPADQRPVCRRRRRPPISCSRSMSAV